MSPDATQVASGAPVAPAAAAVVCSIPLANLPAGFYNVTVTSGVSGAAAADMANMKLAKTGGVAADIANPLPSGLSGNQIVFQSNYVQLDGATNLVVSVIANATAAIKYEAVIEAVRVG